MSHKLITVGTYLTPEEAHLAALVLEKEGIQCYYEAEQTTGNLWYLGTALGVKLQVDEADVPRVRAILEEAHRPTSESSTTVGRCAVCGATMEPGYEVCWSCGETVEAGVTPPAESPSPQQRERSHREAAVADSGADEDDEQCGAEAVERQLDPVSEELVSRAFKVAGVGLVLCPGVLHTYSFWLVLRVAFHGGSLSPAGNRKFYAAMFIDLVVTAIVGMFIFMFLKPP
jgi:hypothetical protein